MMPADSRRRRDDGFRHAGDKYRAKLRTGEVSARAWTEDQRKKHSKISSEAQQEFNKNAEKVAARAARLSAAFKGKKLSAKHRQALSKAAVDRANRSSNNFKHVKWYKASNILGEEFTLRGKLELRIAEQLNSEGRLWTRDARLKYIDSEGVQRSYSPDFFLPAEDSYIEAKGYFHQRDQDKMKLVWECNSLASLQIVFRCW
jgi:hypothetical protein